MGPTVPELTAEDWGHVWPLNPMLQTFSCKKFALKHKMEGNENDNRYRIGAIRFVLEGFMRCSLLVMLFNDHLTIPQVDCKNNDLLHRSYKSGEQGENMTSFLER